jgi:alcohol dehydrogenase, propanol-preferring
MVMRAALLEAPGTPLVIRDVDTPTLAAGQLLIKVEACGVCHTDVHVWERGSSDLRAPHPLILGHEGIGHVAAVAPDVSDWRVGDRAGLAWMHDACGQCLACSDGCETFCQAQRAHGFSVHGGFAEYAVVDARFCARVPPDGDPLQLAPLMCAGLTAYGALETARVAAGSRCAIIGLGGLGMYAVQLAVRRGASVFAFDVVAEKLAQAGQFGAARALPANDRLPDGLAATMDAVINFAPTAATWPLMLSLVRPRGMIVAAALVNEPVPLDQEWLTATGVTITGTSVGTRRQMAELLAIHEAAPLSCTVQSLALADINRGLSDLRDGKAPGRFVIDFRG